MDKVVAKEGIPPPAGRAFRPSGASGGGERIQSLDGLRALSITLVILGHLGGTANFPIPNDVMQFAELGGTGVRVFFVISGFLITTLLLDEHDRSKTISLKAFYLRRTLRIFPAYYAFLLVAVFLRRWGVADSPDAAFLTSVTYTSNYLPDRGWLLGHTWSLGVEEQFYLLWPAVVLFAGPKRAMQVALGVVLAAPLIRVGSWYAGGVHRELIPTSFQCVMDSIAMGCLLCGMRRGLLPTPARLQVVTGRMALSAAVALAVLASIDRPRFGALIGVTASNLAIAVILDHALRTQGGRWIRLLNSSALVLVGKASYSLYLWQQPFINRTGTMALNDFPTNILLAACATVLSYQLVERPSLAFRKRIEARWRPRVKPT